MKDNKKSIRNNKLKEYSAKYATKDEVLGIVEKMTITELKTIVESIGVGIIIQDLDYKVLYENEIQRRSVGNHVGEYCYTAYEGLSSICEDCPMVISYKDREIHKAEREINTEEGMRCYELISSPLMNASGEIIAGIKVVIDITARKLMEKKLQASEDKYRSLVESTDDSIYLVDRNLNYLFMNKKHQLRMELSEDAYKGVSYSEFYPPEKVNDFQEKVDRVFGSGESIQYENKSHRDKKFFLRTLSPVENKEGKIIAVTVISKNITERKQMEEQLRVLSLTDDLTGLNNRRGFLALAQQQIKLAKRLDRRMFLLYIDMDNLKGINDTYGHKEGSLALKKLARIFRETFREADIVARFGGDEFVVLQMESAANTSHILINRLKANLESYNAKREKSYEISVSVGISRYDPHSNESIDELLIVADKSMYDQKRKSV
jgi:diguanylate cyclase (GGDEF)-like protein/PAS domain S-box-containing protein